jgi:hypothetical protein
MISAACPIVSPLQGNKRGKPTATKPMVLPRLLRNRPRNDSAGAQGSDLDAIKN